MADGLADHVGASRAFARHVDQVLGGARQTLYERYASDDDLQVIPGNVGGDHQRVAGAGMVGGQQQRPLAGDVLDANRPVAGGKPGQQAPHGLAEAVLSHVLIEAGSDLGEATGGQVKDGVEDEAQPGIAGHAKGGVDLLGDKTGQRFDICRCLHTYIIHKKGGLMQDLNPEPVLNSTMRSSG